MYKNITYKMILQRMIAKVLEENPNLDIREGSIIFDALAPAAIELKQIYNELDLILDETFADTASHEMLIKRVAERGIIPTPATKAILKGEFNIDIPIGSRFSSESLNYIVIEKIQPLSFKLQCENFGTLGNANLGTLIPINYIDGLKSAQLTKLLIPAEDDEETEHLRERYFRSLNSEAFGGNVTDYKEKTNAIFGVSGVKVYPTLNGGGTVTLVIINSDFKSPSNTLIDEIQSIIDPTQNSGLGVGIAPIGHSVTVLGVNNTLINISTQITYQVGFVWADIKPYVEQTIDNYFEELSQNWADSEQLIIRISQIEIRLLNIDGIIDISKTIINNLEENFVLDSNNIPVRGDING